MVKPGPKLRPAADPAWTPELTYAVGLLATDGCLSPDGRHIDFTSADIQLIETLKFCLGIKTRICWKRGGFTGRLCPRIQFGDVSLYRWLTLIGLTPKKSLTLGVLEVPDEYFFDFLRGSFDGDGSSHAYWDTRWHNSVSLYIAFTSGSYAHLSWIRETLKRLLRVEGPIQPNSRVYALKFAKTASRRIYAAMYYQSDVPCLRRKREKLERQWAALEASRGAKRQHFEQVGIAIRIT